MANTAQTHTNKYIRSFSFVLTSNGQRRKGKEPNIWEEQANIRTNKIIGRIPRNRLGQERDKERRERESQKIYIFIFAMHRLFNALYKAAFGLCRPPI